MSYADTKRSLNNEFDFRDFIARIISGENPDGTSFEIAGAGGGDASGHEIQDEGSALTARSVLNFVGAGVTAADSGGKTTVTIPGGGGGATELEWTKATLANSWVHYQEANPGDGPFFVVQYAIDGDKILFRGMAGGAGASNGTIMVLPSDIRPLRFQRGVAGGPVGTTPGTPVMIQFEPGGSVKVATAMEFVFFDGLEMWLDTDPVD